MVDISAVEVIAPNFKQRLSGVTSTIIQLVPVQAKTIGIATIGPGLPDTLPHVHWTQLPSLWRRPNSGRKRIWHARRNVEMLGGLVLKTLGAPLKLVFTSASQRKHKGWTKFLIRRMDAVIATSRRTASYLEVPNTVAMHGIDAERFSPPASREEAATAVGLDPMPRYVGCFGRVRRQKGTDLFVDAMIALLPANPGWSAIVAGRATAEHQGFEQELIERVRQAGLADRVLFVGEHTDINRWYRALSLFVAPQRWEGFGLTPLEAMASGVPVVATDVGAFSELVEPGRTGAIVPPDNLGAMTEAIRPYLSDGEMLRRQGLAGREDVESKRGIASEAAALQSVYEQVWARD